MSGGDSLGDRMKGYESVPRVRLVRRMPVMMRLDGKAFHTFTHSMPKPYFRGFHECMWDAAQELCEQIQGCQLAYVQSDEITLLLTDYASLKTEAWFDYQVQKMCSVAAAMCSVAFNRSYETHRCMDDFQSVSCCSDNPRFPLTLGEVFDCRVWNLPKEEVVNAFIWRQQDATRNAIQALGQSKFSHNELQGKSCAQIQEMCFQKDGTNFDALPVPQKRGVCIVREYYDEPVRNRDGSEEHLMCQRSRWVVDENIPIFTQDRGYVQRYVDQVGIDVV